MANLRHYPARAELGLSLLLAEDAPDNQRLICRLLQRLGCTVQLASDGQQAIELLRDLVEPLDAVLLDMQMPIVDGFEVARWIRNQKLDLPVFALTAMTGIEDRRRCADAGCSGFIAKPIDRNELYDSLLGVGSRDAAPTA